MKKWNYAFQVPEQKKFRMLVDTDAKNEADDQFAIAHHLMTDKFIVRGILAEQFELSGARWGKGGSVQASMDEIQLILDLMGLKGEVPAAMGAQYPLEDEKTPRDSEAARMIIREAMRDDDSRPLFIGCQGALTNLASAILMEPEICHRATVIWIGGGDYPNGGEEFNLMADPHAANVVMQSDMPLWQVPKSTYKQMSVSLAILQKEVRPCGRIGRYLFEQMVDFNNQKADLAHWPHGEIWGLGDSPTIGLLLAEKERKDMFEEVEAPNICIDDMSYYYDENRPNRKIRVYHDANARMTLEDFFAKLQINYGGCAEG